MSETNPTIKAAVIGYGGAFNMGKAHADWMKAAGIETIAACDIDPARLEAAKKEIPGVQTYADYKELLENPEIDLCVNILPHNLHGSVCVDCSNAGKHVVVEKPMCITVAEADAMIDAAKKNDKMLSVFHNRRWDADFLTIKKTIDEGLIGEVFHIEASIGGYAKPGTWWRSSKEISGGALYDWGAHFLDWILNLVPSEVVGVTGFFKTGFWPGVTNEDHTQAIVRFANGCMADLQVSSLNSAPKPKWRILGTKGSIVGDWGDSITVNVEHNGYIATFQRRNEPSDWAKYYKNIYEHLTAGVELAVKPEESRRTIAIIEAAERSSKSGKTETPAYP